VDAEQAIADLMEISSQVEAAVLVGPAGEAIAASVPPERAARIAGAAARLLDAASTTAGGTPLQLEAATRGGSVFVVREADRTIAATTGPDPTTGLVLYDLRTCLRQLAEGAPEPEPPKTRRRRTTEVDVDAAA
jgi:predicted regulator of Ras-like GTPase activity (Roadblock/LC7/MglB family)